VLKGDASDVSTQAKNSGDLKELHNRLANVLAVEAAAAAGDTDADI
jgi:hypothetical protein